ncbi:MAG: type II secretion system protein [Thiobacillus sp.]
MKRARGFTLIELAIVLVIMTILIGGLAMPLSAQIQARRIAETKKILDEAHETIIGFALSSATSPCTCVYTLDALDPATTCQASLCSARFESMTGTATFNVRPRHYLPCPDKSDDGNPATTTDGDGVAEDRVGGACPVDDGYLPWVTLGVANQDAWGNRLRYAVDSKFSNQAGFSDADNGDLRICDSSANSGASDCGAPGNVASNVVAVVMSHGPNGWGARSVNGTTLTDPSTDNEKENADTDNTDNEFVSGTSSHDFDDLVKWISADQLRGRICPAGGCP